MMHPPAMICLDTKSVVYDHQQLGSVCHGTPDATGRTQAQGRRNMQQVVSIDHSPSALDSRAYEQAVTRFLAFLPHSLSHQQPRPRKSSSFSSYFQCLTPLLLGTGAACAPGCSSIGGSSSVVCCIGAPEWVHPVGRRRLDPEGQRIH